MKKIILFFILIVISPPVFSQWSNDPLINNPVSTAPGDQKLVLTCPDGAGGVIITWIDYNTSTPQIYAQKINAFGQAMWPANGVRVGNFIQNTYPAIRRFRICTDGTGGCIITWAEVDVQAQLYAQRIRTDGVIMWTPDGVLVSRAGGYSEIFTLKIIPAESGSAIFAWLSDYTYGNVFTQKLDAFGNRLWDVNDLQITFINTENLDICTDGANGEYITLSMFPVSLYEADIYAQHVNAAGNTLWPVATIIASAPSGQYDPVMCEDQTGGFIVAWDDRRNSEIDVYASHINSSHADFWTPNGEAICTALEPQHTIMCISDNHSGAYIAWFDNRLQPVPGYSLYYQNITFGGTKRFTADGIKIANKVDFTTEIYPPQIVTVDALGGLIASWVGYYDDALTQYGILAQRMDYNGNKLWDNNGVFVSKGTSMRGPSMIFDGGSSGCIIAWADSRNFGTSGFDVYAQHIKSTSSLGDSRNSGPKTKSSIEQNFPNPFNPTTNISYSITEPGFVSLKIYDMTGREVAELVNEIKQPGYYTAKFDASRLSSGVYFYKILTKDFSETKRMMLVK